MRFKRCLGVVLAAMLKLCFMLTAVLLYVFKSMASSSVWTQLYGIIYCMYPTHLLYVPNSMVSSTVCNPPYGIISGVRANYGERIIRVSVLWFSWPCLLILLIERDSQCCSIARCWLVEAPFVSHQFGVTKVLILYCYPRTKPGTSSITLCRSWLHNNRKPI